MMREPITRLRTRDQVKLMLHSMISDGDLASGERLNEISLSRRIGVSRTPLREALISLESDGLVHSTPNKGFSVITANEALVREVFPILSALEAQALRLSGANLIASAPALAAINDLLANTTDKPKQYKLDSEFHRRLTEHCGNPRLLKLLETHRQLARRFDGSKERGTSDHSGTCYEHSEIIRAIAQGDLANAAETLLSHWRRGEGVVVTWLRTSP